MWACASAELVNGNDFFSGMGCIRMRNYVTGLLVLACMLGRSAYAIGFCDSYPIQGPPTGGGNCQQTRTATEVDGVVIPAYSDLQMTQDEPSSYRPIRFTLDTGLLFRGVTAMDAQHVEVLELGIGPPSQFGTPGGDVSNDRVLTITVDRSPDGRWCLGYTWLAAPANWSIVKATTEPDVVGGDETALFAAGVTLVDVEITPLRGWRQVVVSAQPSGTNRGAASTSSAFNMPSDSLVVGPVRLRTGVLGGDLKPASATQYLFRELLIAAGQ